MKNQGSRTKNQFAINAVSFKVGSWILVLRNCPYTGATFPKIILPALVCRTLVTAILTSLPM